MATKQIAVPGGGSVNETNARQYAIPGAGYYNETATTGGGTTTVDPTKMFLVFPT